MSEQGWIKLHRKLLNWEWFTDPSTIQLFIYLLLKASHNDYKWRGIEITQGSLPFGRRVAAAETGLSEQRVRTAISRLKSTGVITVTKVPKGSIVTIANWGGYQCANQCGIKNQPDSNQGSTTTKKVKNVKKEEYTLDHDIFASDVIGFLNESSGKAFKENSSKTISLIQARRTEGYTLEDFKKVISVKCEDWLHDPKMSKFIRPETIFSNKFENYLNEVPSGEQIDPLLKFFDDAMKGAGWKH